MSHVMRCLASPQFASLNRRRQARIASQVSYAALKALAALPVFTLARLPCHGSEPYSPSCEI
jgi:hypothetical protein